jgi:hypothetical protein
MERAFIVFSFSFDASIHNQMNRAPSGDSKSIKRKRVSKHHPAGGFVRVN